MAFRDQDLELLEAEGGGAEAALGLVGEVGHARASDRYKLFTLVQDLKGRLLNAAGHRSHGFVNGLRVAEHPESEEVLALWVRSWTSRWQPPHSHVSLNAVSLPESFADLERGEAILDAIQPEWRRWKAFRYPFLFEGNTAEKREGIRRYLVAHDYAAARATTTERDEPSLRG